MITLQLSQTVPLTQFIIEQLYGCKFSKILPFLHSNITWIGLGESCLKGYSQVLSHILRLSAAPSCQLTDQKYELVPLSEQACLVTGYYITSVSAKDGRTSVSRQYISFVWRLFSQSFQVHHIHFSSPFIIKQKSITESTLLFHGKNGNNYLFYPNDILYIEAANINCKFYTKEQCTDICQSMNQIEQIMPEYFLRIHRSFIVNKNYVERLKRYTVILKNGCNLPIPEKKYMQIKQNFQKMQIYKQHFT